MPVITVTNTNDSGAGSLRAAVISAVDGDVIDFDAGVIGTGFIDLTSGHIEISKSITIQGPGSSQLAIFSDLARVFYTSAGLPIISGLTIGQSSDTDGGALLNETTLVMTDVIVASSQAANGGGIYNSSTITMTDCAVQNCGATVDGGGIYNNGGTITATNLNVTGNICVGNGAGVFNAAGSTYTQTGGSISTNQSSGGTGSGGAVYNTTASFSITEVSVDGNTAPGNAGGIQNLSGSTVTVVRCVISNNDPIGCYNDISTFNIDNSTVSGNVTAGFYNANFAASEILHSTITDSLFGIITEQFTVLHIQNTIVAGNSNTDVDDADAGDIISDGYNIFGTLTNPIAAGPSDQFGVTLVALKIGPLQDNGGPTFTHALLTGSPAIDAGTNVAAPATDQRGTGFARVVNSTIDIGAFEIQETPCFTVVGTLPSWVIQEGDCLVVKPGTFRGTTKAEADAKARAALDAYIASALASGDIVCNGEMG